MPYYTTTEVAKINNLSARALTNALNSKSCIYKNPKNKKQWNVYDSFTEGVKSPYKRSGCSILWSEEMLERIGNVLKKKVTKTTTETTKVVDEYGDRWYLRKYFDRTHGDVFQMTRQTKGPGLYAPLDDNKIRYNFGVDCGYMGIRSRSKKRTKLLTSKDPNFGKWNTYMILNRIQ